METDTDSPPASIAHHPLQRQLQQTNPLPNQQQSLSAAQQSTPPPRQYTTVGSVYHPHPQPLQPPVRRGRTVKSLFPYKSDSPAGQSQLQYTPLQQNSDRAISPARVNPDSLHDITHQERQVLQKFGVAVPNIQQTINMPRLLQSPIGQSPNLTRHDCDQANTSIGAIAGPVATPSSTMVAHANANATVNSNADSDNESDGADTKPIAAMNFNSLTNLASYPNPMQRAAQRVLASHRPHPATITTTASQMSDKKSTHDNAETVLGVPPVENPEYMPSLPRVRGAPAPLTAGPPGHRQFRPTTVEQDTLRRVREVDNNSPMMNPYHARLPFVQHTSGASLENDRASPAPTANTIDDDNAPVVDTLSMDEAAVFYPDGLPSNFNLRTQRVSRNWELERLSELQCQSDLYLIQSQREFWVKRRNYINDMFYSGNNMINKTFNMAVSEHNHRYVSHTVGHPYNEPQNKGKIVNRPIRIQDASLMPASEHAAPLLSMAYQAMINRPEISPYTKLPKYEHSLYPPYLKT
ncbi:hypothetical protein HD806DRAFT_550899 [Xylariaceae sp. AK1471]|nr:hypothetical protein HD806DRAFT_550899 [Xylariaceae sp. AK1471]